MICLEGSLDIKNTDASQVVHNQTRDPWGCFSVFLFLCMILGSLGIEWPGAVFLCFWMILGSVEVGWTGSVFLFFCFSVFLDHPLQCGD